MLIFHEKTPENGLESKQIQVSKPNFARTYANFLDTSNLDHEKECERHRSYCKIAFQNEVFFNFFILHSFY
jgi:hypothetical protein